MVWETASWPRKVIFGAGALDRLEAEICLGQVRRAVVVTDKFLATGEAVKKIKADSAQHGVEMLIFDEVEPNPSEATVQRAAEAIKGGDCQMVIALGGGSSIDCAKAANVVATHGGVVGDYRRAAGSPDRITSRLLPLVAIPTTAGTGSEASPIAVVTDVSQVVKYILRSEYLVPSLAILDPQLTLSLPPRLTAWTGLDALAHGIESYISVLDFPVGMTLALDAITAIGRFLPVAVEDGGNALAREKMMLAAYMAGLAMSQNGLGLAHALGHQLTAQFGLAHGLACAILLPPVMRFNLKAAQDKLADVARALGEDVSGINAVEAAHKTIEAVEKLLKTAGVPAKAEGVALTDKTLDALVTKAMAEPTIRRSPRVPTAEEVAVLFKEGLGG